MMKTKGLIATISVLALIMVCMVSPVSHAASMEETGTVSFRTDYSFIKTDLASEMKLTATNEDYTCDRVYICNESEFEAFRNGSSNIPSSKVVMAGEKAGVNGTYWVVSNGGEYLSEEISGLTVTNSMEKMNMSKYTFTVMQNSNADVTIHFSGNNDKINILVIDDHASADVSAKGVKGYTPTSMAPIVHREIGITGDGSEFSFTCKNTSTYALFIESDGSQTLDVSVEIDGVANFINSTAISIFLIVIAIGTVGALIYIATKKII